MSCYSKAAIHQSLYQSPSDEQNIQQAPARTLKGVCLAIKCVNLTEYCPHSKYLSQRGGSLCSDNSFCAAVHVCNLAYPHRTTNDIVTRHTPPQLCVRGNKLEYITDIN